MFAPPVAKPKAQTASNDVWARPRATPFGQRHGDVEPAPIFGPLPQVGANQNAHGSPEQDACTASTSAKGGSPGRAWNFCSVPAYLPGREKPFDEPPGLAPRFPIQAKLKVGAVDDPLEHEADRVADQVMRMPAPEAAVTSAPPQVSRKCAECEEEEKLQTKPAGPQPAAGAWNFCSVPAYLPGREKPFQEPPGLAPRLPIQAKLKVGAVDDPLEHEADRVADQVMRIPAPTLSIASGPTQLSRKCTACEGEEMAQTLRSKPATTLAAASGEAPSIVQEVLRSSGAPLDQISRSFMEPRFGHDFRRVRVHTDAKAAESARSINALAYTVGQDIVFGDGQYTPRATRGQHLLAHELAHVVQQGNLGGTGVVQRAISKELDKIESLLSYGIFDWAITDAEAVEALQILERLPKYQQAVFFSNKKYADRLRDNLPEERLPELNQIEAGVADIRPPSVEIEDIREKLSYGLFDWVVTDKDAVEALEKLKKLPEPQLTVALSDHGLMKNNESDWAPSGVPYGEPEWYIGADNKAVSKPISQNMSTNITAEVSLNVLPLTAPAAPISLRGESDEAFLTFSHSGTMAGGSGQKILLTSVGTLPPAVRKIHDKQIHWRMKWQDWDHDIAQSTHTIFVTMGAPHESEDGAVTHKRMATAVKIIGPLGTVPHDIVKGIMRNWNRYALEIPLHVPVWKFADEVEAGGQCIDIVRFVRG